MTAGSIPSSEYAIDSSISNRIRRICAGPGGEPTIDIHGGGRPEAYTGERLTDESSPAPSGEENANGRR